MDGYDIAVIDSYVSDFKEKGADTQALWAYNSPGPLKIFNNYLEAAGENVMFGGADSRITNLVPSDIEIKRNHFFKPLSWMSASWSVKNHLEFKNAQRVLVEGNIFENNWPHAQNGMSILLTPRNETGGMPWAAAKDITIRLNKLVNVGQAFNVSGTDSNYPELGVLTRRVLIENNQINVTGIGNADGRMFQIINGPIDFTIDHNTGFCTGPLGVSENSPKADQFVFTNNITTKGSYGFTGSGTGEGTATLNAYYTTWQFTKNAIIVGTSGNYPSGNYFPANTGAVGFINYAAADYRLSASSPYKNAGADGKDLGADIDAIEAAIAGIGIPQAPKSLRLIQ
jgi:hypothetical protein